MDYLVQWVSQIIILILLATIIDLLVPATAMRKYVKLVVGLILVLVFLKPVFYVFNMDIQQALDRSEFQFVQGEGTAQNTEKLIEMQKREIQASQDAYILEEMTVQLEELAETPLKEEHQAAIKDISFAFDPEDDLSYESLDEITVYVQEQNEGEGTVEMVEEVVIDTKERETEHDSLNTDQIEQALQEAWEISDEKISVVWEGGTS